MRKKNRKNKKEKELGFKIIEILKYFFDNPYSKIYIRELARKLKISSSIVKKYVDFLLKEKILIEEREANLKYVKANLNNPFFRQIKIAYNVKKILDSGLIDYLINSIPTVSSIVLFGSTARGLDDYRSDIDILVIGKEKLISLSKYEEKLKREINLHIFSWANWKLKAKKDSPFYYEVIIYGIPLYGELPIVK